MRRTAQLLAAVALVCACSSERVPTGTSERNPGNTIAPAPSRVQANRESDEGDHDDGPSLRRDLATLRRVTAPFHSFKRAGKAGWSAQITPCMVDPGGAGGMGFHYGNTDLFNGSVSVDKPELLLYEPDRNGQLDLVAVEYIIPYTFHARSAEAPTLFGQKFVQNDTFQLWGLHVWIWKDNPSGLFASWNPRVNCKHATAVSIMSHN